jgi:hypothetical protein
LRAMAEKNATAGAADLVGQEAPTDHRLHGVGELIAQPRAQIRLPPSAGLARTVPRSDPRALTIRSCSQRLIRGMGRA